MRTLPIISGSAIARVAPIACTQTSQSSRYPIQFPELSTDDCCVYYRGETARHASSPPLHMPQADTQQKSFDMRDVKNTTLPTEHHATEFLANERTFLAWVRTSIAVISLGFAVTKFDMWLKEIAKSTGVSDPHGIGWSIPMGLALIILGGLLPVFAAWRYHVVNQQIEQDHVRADRGMIIMVTLLVVALAFVFFLYFLKSNVNW